MHADKDTEILTSRVYVPVLVMAVRAPMRGRGSKMYVVVGDGGFRIQCIPPPGCWCDGLFAY